MKSNRLTTKAVSYLEHRAIRNEWEVVTFIEVYLGDKRIYKARLDSTTTEEGEPGDSYIYGYAYRNTDVPPLEDGDAFYEFLKEQDV